MANDLIMAEGFIVKVLPPPPSPCDDVGGRVRHSAACMQLRAAEAASMSFQAPAAAAARGNVYVAPDASTGTVNSYNSGYGSSSTISIGGIRPGQ